MFQYVYVFRFQSPSSICTDGFRRGAAATLRVGECGAKQVYRRVDNRFLYGLKPFGYHRFVAFSCLRPGGPWLS
jgi:hypothetical protein